MSKPTEDPPKERAKESSIANFCDSGKTNEELVNKLRAKEILKTDEIIQAFLKVDRGKFLPPELKDKAYEDTPLRCKYEGGIVHQSAPHMYAHILEHMQIKPGHAILNVGSGTGYLSTLFAWFAGSEGTNHGVELYRSNVVFAQRHALMEMFREGSFAPIVFFSENIFNMNVNKNIQYDRIYVGANCKREQVSFFLPLLKDSGWLIVPSDGEFLKIVRDGSSYTQQVLMHVRFAELEQLKPDQAPRSFTCDTRADQTARRKLMQSAREDSTQNMSRVSRSRLKTPSSSGFDIVNTGEKVSNEETGTGKPVIMISLQVSSMKKFAHQLTKFLRDNGHNVWICTQSMSGGDSWRREIVKAVKRCHVFIPLINNPWAESGECEVEFNLAFNLYTHSKGKPRLPIFVPVAFPDLDWNAHAHVELLAANTNFITHSELDTTCNAVLQSINSSIPPLSPVKQSINEFRTVSSASSTTSNDSTSTTTPDQELLSEEYPELYAFLNERNMLKYGYGKALVDEGFDTLELLKELTDEDMVEMNFKKGHRRALIKAIKSL